MIYMKDSFVVKVEQEIKKIVIYYNLFIAHRQTILNVFDNPWRVIKINIKDKTYFCVDINEHSINLFQSWFL